MKKIYSIFVLAAVAAAFASCSKEDSSVVEEPVGNVPEQVLLNPVTITFTADPSTKVAIDGSGHAAWEEGDKIQICSFDALGDAKYVKDIAVNAADGTFTATVEDSENYYAVYPSDLSVTLDKNSSDQDVVKVLFKGGRDAETEFRDAAWYAAKTTKAAKSFAFKPVSAVIKFKVEDADVQKVYFRSFGGALTYLQGQVPVAFDGSNVPVLSAPDATQANVSVNVNGAGTYYLTLPASGETATHATNGDGFIMQLQKEGEAIPAAYWDNAITLAPGNVYNLSSSVDAKIVRNYYVSPDGTGNGLAQSSPMSLAALAATPGFKYATQAAAMVLDGVTVNLLGSAVAYGAIPASKGTAAHSWNVVGGVGGGTTTVTSSGASAYVNTNANSTVNFSNIEFKGSTKAGAGVALNLSKGVARLVNCRFESNASSNGGGAAIYVSSTGTVMANNCTFVGNTGTKEGWTIGGTGATTKIGLNNCTIISAISSNSASTNSVMHYQGEGVVANTSIINTTANGKRGLIALGTAVSASKPNAFNVVNCALENAATEYGAFWFHNNYNMNVNWCVFTGETLGGTATQNTHFWINNSLDLGKDGTLGTTDTKDAAAAVQGITHKYYTYDLDLVTSGYTKPTLAQLRESIAKTGESAADAKDGFGQTFLTWLESIGALTADITGKTRPAGGVCPGSYEQ